MRIKIQQFLFGKLYSWAICGQNLGRALIKQGHEVHFVSTDGVIEKFIPEDLKPYIRLTPEGKYDMQYSFTAPHNFPNYLQHGTGNRFGHWLYEFDYLPPGVIKYINNSCDKFISASSFFTDICFKNKINKNKLETIPYGINWKEWREAEPLYPKKEGEVRWLVDFSQPHLRKGISEVLECWGRAFTKSDNVLLVLKVRDKKPEMTFDVSFSDEWEKFKKKYPNHASCKVIKEYLSSMRGLYKSCDGLFMLPKAEGFFLPALQFLASGGIVITSNYGGQLDFLNENNSILINGKMTRAPKEAQYWIPSTYSSWFSPDLDEAVEKLIYATKNIVLLREKFHGNLGKEFFDEYSWDNVARRITELCQ